MGESRPRTQFILTAAAVLAVHVVLCWLLLGRSKILILPGMSGSLELMFIPPREKSSGSLAGQTAPKKARPQPAIGSQSEESNAIQPPIDWDAELVREARVSAASGPAAQSKDFGFPATPLSPPVKHPEFGWDYARTHRVQSIPGGGVLVNLNDSCVLVFNPLPFFFCQPGHKPANGELFKHMIPPSFSDPAAP